MAKIDTTTIEGYADMTAEQKLAALEALEIPEAVDLSGYVKKSVFDAKASEAATKSRELKALKDASLTEEQRIQQERAEFEQEKLSFTKERNATKIKGIFGAAGLKEEEYSALPINDFTDETTAITFANSILSIMQNSRTAGETAARQSLLGGKAPEAGTPIGESERLRTAYREAVNKGDFATQSYCMRKASELKITL